MPDDLPAAAVRLAERATENGWTVKVRTVQAEWKGKTVRSHAVWLKRSTARAIALWERDGHDAWKFRTACQVLDGEYLGPNVERLSARQLAALVTGEPTT